MKKAILEIIYLALCFIAIMTASVLLLYFDNYSESFVIIGVSLLALFIYILIKLFKKK